MHPKADLSCSLRVLSVMTQSRHFGQLSRFQMSRRKSVLPGEMMLGALGGFDEEFVAIYSIVTSRSACDPDWNRRMS